MAADDAIRAVIDELYKCLSIDNMIGEPIEIDDKIIIPVTKMGVVFGTGLQGSQENCIECAAGGGGGISPAAVVIISKGIKGPEGVKIIHLAKPSPQVGLSESLNHIVSAAVSRLSSSSATNENKASHDPKTD